MSHTFIRFLVVIAMCFLVSIFVEMIHGQDRFLEYLREWKLLTIVSVVVLMWHTAQELTTALEDYVSTLSTRQILIRIMWGVGAISAAAISISIGGL